MGEPEPEVTEAEVVEGTVEEQATESGQAVVPHANNAAAPPANQAPGGDLATLWGSSTPGEIVQQAADVAKHLTEVLEKSNMLTPMGTDRNGNPRNHVNIEGWQTCGTLLGLQGLTISIERVEPINEFEVRTHRKKWGKIDGKRQVIEENTHTWTATGYSYECVAEIRTMDGRVVGRGQAICSREEAKWMEAEDSAVMGMAQTRAHSRAFRQALGFIVGMAGYSPTPAEEMEAAGVAPEQPAGPAHGEILKDADKRFIRDQAAKVLMITEGPNTAAANELLKAVAAQFGYVPYTVAWALDWAAKYLEQNLPPETLDTAGDTTQPTQADQKAQAEAGEENQEGLPDPPKGNEPKQFGDPTDTPPHDENGNPVHPNER